MVTAERIVATYGQFQVKEITKKIRLQDPGLVRYNVYVAGDEFPTPLLSFAKTPSSAEIRSALQQWFQSQDEFIKQVRDIRSQETGSDRAAGMSHDIDQRTRRINLVRAALPTLGD